MICSGPGPSTARWDVAASMSEARVANSSEAKSVASQASDVGRMARSLVQYLAADMCETTIFMDLMLAQPMTDFSFNLNF